MTAPVRKDLTSAIAKGLDSTDALPVGAGRVDLFGFGRGTRDAGVAGAGVSYQHRVDGSLSLWGQGEAGLGWGATPGLSYEALAGLRWRF